MNTKCFKTVIRSKCKTENNGYKVKKSGNYKIKIKMKSAILATTIIEAFGINLAMRHML